VAAIVLASLVLASCGGGGSSGVAGEDDAGGASTTESSTTAPAEAEEEVVEFSWTTSYVGDGYGVTVEVTGTVGEGWASYSLHGIPVVGDDGGDYADLVPTMVGAGMNGLVDGTVDPSSVDDIDPAGVTEVLVEGDARWYRVPWLLDEMPFALGGAEWVRVDASSELPPIDLATYVVSERFDGALEDLRLAAADGATFTPSPPGDDEVAALFGPWVGLDGAIRPTGDDAEGEARWGETYTYEPDGVDGFARGEVSWQTVKGSRPRDLPPDRSIAAERVSAAMG
jgi:hypothetical protein